MRRLVLRSLFVVSNVALLATFVIAILGAFTPLQHPIGRLISIAVLSGIALWPSTRA